MRCSQARQELSRQMDGELAAGPDDLAQHLQVCRDCAEFRSTATEFADEYRRQLRTGIDLLRRSESPAPWEGVLARRSLRRRAWAALPLAAAGLLCWFGRDASRIADPVPDRPAPVAKASPRLRLIDDLWKPDDAAAEVDPLVLGWEPRLPIRLDQDLLPARSEEVDVRLPSSLRF